MAEPAAGERAGNANFVTADVRAAPVGLPGRVVRDRPVGRANDAQQVPLVAPFATGDAGSGRNCSTLEPDRRRAYDDTSPAAAFVRRVRPLVVPLEDASPTVAPTATGSPALASGSAAGLFASASSASAAGSASALAGAALRVRVFFAGLASGADSVPGAASGSASGAAEPSGSAFAAFAGFDAASGAALGSGPGVGAS